MKSRELEGKRNDDKSSSYVLAAAAVEVARWRQTAAHIDVIRSLSRPAFPSYPRGAAAAINSKAHRA